jgi:subtilisin family serine protease
VELYVAKIADSKPSEPAMIAKAVLHAVGTWQVDIISMPFGFPANSADGYPELEAALMTAYSSHVLVFAAASNNGGKLGRSFPAREPTVFAAHSTDANGNRSAFSPTAAPDDVNLATVGEAVESAWPVHLCDDEANPVCVAHKSGTSYATSILAGISAFLLTYARVHLPERRAAELRGHKRMKAVLRRVAAKGTGGGGYKPRDGYYFVDISLYADSLFGKDKEFIDLTIADLLGG